MSRPIVILIPAYRCERTILETLESIQKQGTILDEIQEVIIADDGSGDSTVELARAAWSSRVPLRILERRFNCGEYASVNNAVEDFPPDVRWFLIMHADNIAKPGWLKTFLDRIDKAGDHVGIIGSSYDSFTEDGRVTKGENEPGDPVVTVAGTRAAVADTLRMGCWWHISSCAIRVETFVRVGGLPKVMQLKGDWDFMLRVLADGWTMEHLPKSLMLYRDNPGGSSSNTFRRHMDIWETMAVIGRFHAALGGVGLTSIHSRYMWHLCRRVASSMLKVNLIRLLWIFPAMGCIVASYWTCVADRGKKFETTPRGRISLERNAVLS
jgi:glycosyltransferase involved in cell wall biosynthesis